MKHNVKKKVYERIELKKWKDSSRLEENESNAHKRWKNYCRGFPGGSAVKNSPANAGYVGSILG